MLRHSTAEDVREALRGAHSVSYNRLLDLLRARGIEPRGMAPILDGLERDGFLEQLDRQGKRWGIDAGYEGSKTRGPLYLRRIDLSEIIENLWPDVPPPRP